MRKQKKGEKGIASNYVSRTKAVRKLNVTLKDFRRLCILKGIFPRDPSKKPKGSSKTFYHKKDLLYLSHEPLLKKFRDLKVFLKKHSKALAKQEVSKANSLLKHKPKITFDHLVRERYPTFIDAVRDLDDALCMVHLYAMLPSGTTRAHSSDRGSMCLRLAREFQLWVARSQALRKVFVSIKGIYYSAVIAGQVVTWNVPHQFSQSLPHDVDYKVMMSFLDFYETSVKFVNFKLYHDSGLYYPPKLDSVKDDQGYHLGVLVVESLKDAASRIAKEKEARELARQIKNQDLPTASIPGLKKIVKGLVETESILASEVNVAPIVPEDSENFSKLDDSESASTEQDQEEMQIRSVFSKCIILLGRETPQDSLEFVIVSGGGRVIREVTGQKVDATIEFTHQIIDRPVSGQSLLQRVYIQPQWVYDSFNCRAMLPAAPYAPGVKLPPHLSPFVDDMKEGYIPAQRNILRQWTNQAPLILENEQNDDEVSKKLKSKTLKLSTQETNDEEEYARGLAKERSGQGFEETKNEDSEESGSEIEEDSDSEDEEVLEMQENDSSDEEEENLELDPTLLPETVELDDSDDEEAEAAREAAFEARLQAKRSKILDAHKNLTPDQQHKEFSKMMLSNKKLKLYNKMQKGITKKSEATKVLIEKRKLNEKLESKAAKASSNEAKVTGKRKTEAPIEDSVKKSKSSKSKK